MRCTEKEFLDSISQHKIEVLFNNGLYQRIRFQRPSSNVYMFDIITWPGHLCYTGDMGTFVFKRLDDMLVFFRDPRRVSDQKGLYVNFGYWAEKCIAWDNVKGIKEYNPEAFVEAVEDYLRDNDVSADIQENVRIEILPMKNEGEEFVRQAISEYNYKGFTFDEFYDYDLTDYTYHFTWCCYALAWGVKMLDNLEIL